MKYISFLIFALMISCGSGQKPAKEAPEVTAERKFEMPQVPVAISEPEARARYLVEHFWDKFDFADTVWLQHSDVVEQEFANYINFMNFMSLEESAANVRKLADATTADSTMFRYFDELFEKYLHDPNSPYRNDELYIPVLESLIANPMIGDIEKSRPRYRLEMALKNRPGHRANDFRYTDIKGGQGRLSAIQSEYILLYFYNPGCANCRQTREQMILTPILDRMQEDNRLRIVAIYSEADHQGWQDYRDNIPPHWVNGHANVIVEEDLYDLKAMPTLYLLDKDKNVLLKDAPLESIEHYLIQQTQ